MNCRAKALFVLSLLIAGCADKPQAADSPQAPPAVPEPALVAAASPEPELPAAVVDDGLDRAIWRLASSRDGKGARIRAIHAKPGIPFSLVFAKGRLQVRNACNHIIGEYRLGEEGAFAIDKLQRAEKVCPNQAEMTAENTLYAVLEKLNAIELPANAKGRLHLRDDAGNVLSFEPVPMPGN